MSRASGARAAVRQPGVRAVLAGDRAGLARRARRLRQETGHGKRRAPVGLDTTVQPPIPRQRDEFPGEGDGERTSRKPYGIETIDSVTRLVSTRLAGRSRSDFNTSRK